tara:strand:+ start:247 stop:1812 length:1566 start_codon:yes stop_codon:yes gene_type:complete
MLKTPFWKVFLILFVCFAGTFYAVPSFIQEKNLASYPDWFPKEQINLGLDLRGGLHMLLEVDFETAEKDRLAFVVDEVRKNLRQQRIGYLGLRAQKGAVIFKLRDQSDQPKISKALRSLGQDYSFAMSDGETFEIRMNEKAHNLFEKNILNQSIEIVNRRINELGTREPNIQRQGKDRIIVQLPGVQDAADAKRLLGKTAKMTFRMVHPEQPYADSARSSAPAGYEVLPSNDGHSAFYVVRKKVEISGEHLVDAQVSYDEYNAPQVSFRMDNVGGRKFADITAKNIGKPFAIILDKKVISAPRINGIIPSGSGVITGRFSVQEANDLALLMRAGALPAPLTILEERLVGPDLGADSIEAGQNATIVSVIVIVAFMVLVYLFFGLIANVALVFNLILLVAALTLTGSTLTLPGIAGIALTMGMAVDANVLIFERIKEELQLGKRAVQAIDAGYKRAIATILDSNLTTLIGAAALYFFGSGPIKGFGVTLAFGIIISMFTAISLTRMLVVWWFNIFKPKTLSL